MSDTPQAPDWWQASDLRWYPPDQTRAARRRRAMRRLVGVAVALAVVAATSVAWFVVLDDEPVAAASEVLLEPAESPGPDPFSASVAIVELVEFPAVVEEVVAETLEDLPTDPGSGTRSAPAATPGLYGGTGDEQMCDVASLNAFLTDPANADKATAWAQVAGVAPEGITDLLETTTSTVLTIDTLVTNHGFADGVATPRQSVLQAGTAVLVDTHGVPRVKCGCGNPLTDPDGGDLAAAETDGEEWAGFAPESTVVTASSSTALTHLTVTDLDDGDLVVRDTGSRTEQVVAAVGERPGSDGSVIVVSDGGTDWTEVAVTDGPLTAVAWGDGRFVAIGDDLLLTSEDGRSWTERSPIDQPVRDVAWGNGRWVAVAADRTWTSPDAINWSEEPPILFDHDDNEAHAIAFADGQFLVAVSRCDQESCRADDILTSADGRSFTRSPVTAPGEHTDGGTLRLAATRDVAAVGNTLRDTRSGGSDDVERGSSFVAMLEGDRWQFIQDDPAVRLGALAGAGTAWFALSDDAEPVVVTSRDLSGWEELGRPGRALHALAVSW